MIFYIIFSVLLLLLSLILLYFKIYKKYDFNNQKTRKIIKILSIVFFILNFINLFLPDGFAIEKKIEELKLINGFYENTIRWLNATCLIVIPLTAFYDNKYINKMATYVCLPSTLLYVYSYDVVIKSLTSSAGRGLNSIRFMSEGFKTFMLNEVFRGIIFGIIGIIQITILLLLLLKNLNDLKFKKNEILNFIFLIFGVLALSISSYTFQYYIGYTDLIFKRFSLMHLIVVLGIIAEIIGVYLIFKNKSVEIKRIVLIAMSISLLFQFSQVFTGSSELKVQKFPFQLCNLGSYLMLFTLMTKNEKLFHFTITVNVTGALIAMAMLDVNNVGIGQYWNIHYILEHAKVITIPILALLLKEFKPLQLKDISHFFIGFSIYFAFVFIFGTISNGLYIHFNNDYFKTNFLFMFDQEAAYKLLPFAGKLFDINFSIGMFKIFPVVQILIYLVFNVLCSLIFFSIYGFGKLANKKE